MLKTFTSLHLKQEVKKNNTDRFYIQFFDLFPIFKSVPNFIYKGRLWSENFIYTQSDQNKQFCIHKHPIYINI